jgi:hypothetical protein
MNREPQNPERRRLPGADEPAEPPAASSSPPGPRDGLRRVRRMSNWTAAGLIAATAVTTGYLARGSLTTGTRSATAQASTATPAGAAAPGTHKTCITVPVATSGGSGITSRAPMRACGSGTGGSGPVVVYVTRPANSGDN